MTIKVLLCFLLALFAHASCAETGFAQLVPESHIESTNYEPSWRLAKKHLIRVLSHDIVTGNDPNQFNPSSGELIRYTIIDAIVPPFAVSRLDTKEQLGEHLGLGIPRNAQLNSLLNAKLESGEIQYVNILRRNVTEDIYTKLDAQLKELSSRPSDVKIQSLIRLITDVLDNQVFYPIKTGRINIPDSLKVQLIKEAILEFTCYNYVGYTIKSDEAVVEVLDISKKVWMTVSPDTSDNETRGELETLTSLLARNVEWKTADIEQLRLYADILREKRSPGSAAFERLLTSLEPRKELWLLTFSKVWVAHAFFWVLLIFAYPKFPQVQAIFFWNPWIRRIIGLGYVEFALTWIPYLRSKLFSPFRESLLADTALELLKKETYFEGVKVMNQATGGLESIEVAITETKGEIVLQGESGLGKSMFLRRLVGRSRRVAVFLPAKKCESGVIEAIQEKLHGLPKDLRFLRNLIFSGALDICIDGLNEVSASTRSEITSFAESYFKANIIMATQPIEWRVPATAKTYSIQPLSPDQIQGFLVLFEKNLPENAKLHGSEYRQACKSYLDEALSEAQPAEARESAKRILSNPMDLTVVASILARGEKPDLFRLLNHEYEMMAKDYKRLNINQEFPLETFSERVYKMRLQDEKALPAQEFPKEINCMDLHKMVVSRQLLDAENKQTREWFFRHEKIMEFFIVQTFFGKGNERPELHLGDPRFRGVYFLLATLMPFEEAKILREVLIQYAVDTRDHSVSDTFIQILRSRKAP